MAKRGRKLTFFDRNVSRVSVYVLRVIQNSPQNYGVENLVSLTLVKKQKSGQNAFFVPEIL
jgi:hypothetical protein